MVGSSVEGRRPARGAAAVEFALVAPLLLVLVFGIVDYGIMLSFRQNLSQATAEGARAAAVTQLGAAAPYDAVSKANAAIAAALGAGYSCSGALNVGGTLTKDGSTVGTCKVSSTACTSATACVSSTACSTTSVRCTYSVTVTYDYSDHPLVPTILVPLPSTLTYTASAQGNV